MNTYWTGLGLIAKTNNYDWNWPPYIFAILITRRSISTSNYKHMKDKLTPSIFLLIQTVIKLLFKHGVVHLIRSQNEQNIQHNKNSPYVL